MTSGEARIRREIDKCNGVFERNNECFSRTGKRSYYRAAQKAYICAREMEAVLRIAQQYDALIRERERNGHYRKNAQ
jgi:hypothetical protein